MEGLGDLGRCFKIESRVWGVYRGAYSHKYDLIYPNRGGIPDQVYLITPIIQYKKCRGVNPAGVLYSIVGYA